MIRSTAPSPRPQVRPPALKVVGPKPQPQKPAAPRLDVKPEPSPGALARLGDWFEALLNKLKGEKPVTEPTKPAPAKPAPTAPAPLDPAGRDWQALDPDRDRLAVTVKPGQTLYQFARLYGQEDQLGAYVKAIKEVNQLEDSALTPGQKLNMPIGGSAEWKTPMLAAVQRSVDDRRKAGSQLPDLDYTRFQAAQGRFNSFTIDLGLAKGEGSQRFHVLEDMSGDEPYMFKVMLDAEAEEVFRQFER